MILLTPASFSSQLGGGGVLPLEFQHHVTDLLGEKLDHKGGGGGV